MSTGLRVAPDAPECFEAFEGERVRVRGHRAHRDVGLVHEQPREELETVHALHL